MAFPLVSRSFFVTLSSITASHEVFGCQSLMKNVAIVSLSMYSLLRNGVTLKSEIRLTSALLLSRKQILMITALGRFLDGE